MADIKRMDRMGDIEFVGVVFRLFGVHRSMRLFGYGFLFGLLGIEAADAPEIVERLKGSGVSKSSAYRALEDVKVLGEHLRSIDGRERSRHEIIMQLRAAKELHT